MGSPSFSPGKIFKAVIAVATIAAATVGTLTVTGNTSFGGAATWADDIKAIFGDDSDFSVRYDSSTDGLVVAGPNGDMAAIGESDKYVAQPGHATAPSAGTDFYEIGQAGGEFTGANGTGGAGGDTFKQAGYGGSAGSSAGTGGAGGTYTVSGAAGGPALGFTGTGGAGGDVKLLGGDGGAGTDTGGAAGNVLLIPGAVGSGGSPDAGKVIIRQPGGAAGTDEIQMYHNGTVGIIRNMNSAASKFRFADSASDTYGQTTIESERFQSGLNGGGFDLYYDNFQVRNDFKINWSSDTGALNAKDTGLARDSAGVLKVTDGSTGYGVMKADEFRLTNEAEGGTGTLNFKTARESHTLALSTSSTTTINLASNVLIYAVQMNVDTAVTDDAGDDTWTATIDDGATVDTVVTGAAAAQDTKVNKCFAPILTDATTNIKFTPNGGNFSGGVIEVVIHYMDLTSMANAP